MFAFDMGYKSPSKLMDYLSKLGREVPDWMRNELEMDALDHTISKGTRVVLIYRAMVEAAPEQKG